MLVWQRGLGALAGVLGAAGVGLAAVGAHRSGNPEVTTAAYFLLFHAPALLALCAFAGRRVDRGLLVAGSLIGLGAVLFSGDLALRGLAGLVIWHKAAPTGGMLMILGWLVAAFAVPSSLSDDRFSP